MRITSTGNYNYSNIYRSFKMHCSLISCYCVLWLFLNPLKVTYLLFSISTDALTSFIIYFLILLTPWQTKNCAEVPSLIQLTNSNPELNHNHCHMTKQTWLIPSPPPMETYTTLISAVKIVCGRNEWLSSIKNLCLGVLNTYTPI